MITNLSYYEKQEENSSIGSRKGGVETMTAARDMTTGNTGRHILTFLLPVLLAESVLYTCILKAINGLR